MRTVNDERDGGTEGVSNGFESTDVLASDVFLMIG